MRDDILGVLENEDKGSYRRMCFCTGVLTNLNELILGMDLCPAIGKAVSLRFKRPRQAFGTIKPSSMQQGMNMVLLRAITLYRLNIYRRWPFKINTASGRWWWRQWGWGRRFIDRLQQGHTANMRLPTLQMFSIKYFLLFNICNGPYWT